MSNEIATVMFVLVLALQVCVSGLGPIWAGAVIPALYGSLAGVTVVGYYQAFGAWPLRMDEVLVQGGLPILALLLVWLGVQHWKRWGRARAGHVRGKLEELEQE